MPRQDVNRSGELEVFVRTVERGSFSGAARELQMTPSGVSKLITRLESRLGVRLINRSTRQIHLTPEGQLFYERGVSVLADLDEAERTVGIHNAPRGRLRVNANVPFGHHFLIPLVPSFTARYPDVTLDIALTDEVVDLLEQRTDVAVRAGPLKSSSLMARKLGQTRMVIVGSRRYAEQHGLPTTVQDLEHHNLLSFNYTRSMTGWPLRVDGELIRVPTVGNVQISDGQALKELVLAGAGLARMAAFHVKDDIDQGRLLPVLETCNPGDLEEIHAVFVGQGGHMPLRVRVFLDFLAEHVHVSP